MINGCGNTPLEIAWRRDELEHKMSESDYLMGGPRKMLTILQYAKANGYDMKTGEKR